MHYTKENNFTELLYVLYEIVERFQIIRTV